MEPLTIKSSSVLGFSNSNLILSSSLFFLIGAAIMELLLAINIAWSCISTFECSKFLPTISYLACFRGHDRLFALSMTYWSVFLMCFHLVCFMHFQTESKWFNRLFFLTGLGICGVQPFVSIFDEGNTSYYAKIEKIHSGIMIGMILAVLLWIYLTSKAKTLRIQLLKYINIGLLVLLISFFEWFYAEKDNFIFNYYLEAITEWSIVTMAVFLPYLYSLEFKEIVIKSKIRDF